MRSGRGLMLDLPTQTWRRCWRSSHPWVSGCRRGPRLSTPTCVPIQRICSRQRSTWSDYLLTVTQKLLSESATTLHKSPPSNKLKMWSSSSPVHSTVVLHNACCDVVYGCWALPLYPHPNSPPPTHLWMMMTMKSTTIIKVARAAAKCVMNTNYWTYVIINNPLVMVMWWCCLELHGSVLSHMALLWVSWLCFESYGSLLWAAATLLYCYWW